MSCGLPGFGLGSGGIAMPKPKKSKTHFEQVPLETLRDIIADGEIPDDEADGNEAIVASPAK
jgi:hypothetical protein